MAARNENEGTSDGETYIEKYIRGVLQVENILSLERLRQVNSKKALSLLHLVVRYEAYLNLNQKRSRVQSKESLIFETGLGMRLVPPYSSMHFHGSEWLPCEPG